MSKIVTTKNNVIITYTMAIDQPTETRSLSRRTSG